MANFDVFWQQINILIYNINYYAITNTLSSIFADVGINTLLLEKIKVSRNVTDLPKGGFGKLWIYFGIQVKK